MSVNRNNIYSILFIACMAGYSWIYLNGSHSLLRNKSVDVCLFKQITTIPCPSCGTTRSVIALTNGNFSEAIGINPLGYVIATIMLLTPCWIALDFVIKRKTLFEFYKKMEALLKQPKYALPLLTLVLINWVWNITKGL